MVILNVIIINHNKYLEFILVFDNIARITVQRLKSLLAIWQPCNVPTKSTGKGKEKWMHKSGRRFHYLPGGKSINY